MGEADPGAAERHGGGPSREVREASHSHGEVSPAAEVERALREHWGRLLALLTRLVGSLDVAEEALQDAYATALTAWERDGVPDRTDAWLLTTARRKALDRLRREATLARRLPLLVVPDAEARAGRRRRRGGR